MELNVKKKNAWWFWTCVWLFLLVGETVRVGRVPFLPCLDLLLLMVSTWSSTRWCPERSLSSEGSASDVSSAPELVSADLSGSAVIIFFFFIFRPRLLRWSSKTNANNQAARLGGARRAKNSSGRSKGVDGTCPEERQRAPPFDTAPRLGGTGESSHAGAEWREGPGHASKLRSQPNTFCFDCELSKRPTFPSPP